jgi:hypothetical protein
MKKISVGLLELETAVLECFLEKTPLSPVGVKISNYSYDETRFSLIINIPKKMELTKKQK